MFSLNRTLMCLIWAIIACGSSPKWSEATNYRVAASCSDAYQGNLDYAPYCACVSSELEKRFSDEEVNRVLDGSKETGPKWDEAINECQTVKPEEK